MATDRATQDEGSRLAAALLNARLCHRCIAVKSEIAHDQIAAAIQSLQRHLTVIELVDDCHGCDRRTVVSRIV
jgi:hypothetical protein